MLPDLLSDPFGERSIQVATKRFHLLGARVHFASNSRRLMDFVDSAYQGLPQRRFSLKPMDLQVSLHLRPELRKLSRIEAPPFTMLSGPGLLAGATDSSNFVVISPSSRAALVVVSPRMLRFPYHTRYELIEFAVFTLAARAQHLVPLHAACIGRGEHGVLLMGPSGAGKSTVALHCLLDGFDFVSEDSAFVSPDTLLATGVSNFIHIRANSLRWLGRSPEVAAIRSSPVIRRRSGVEKFEVDLRREGFRLAKSPLKIVGAVFISPESAGKRALLKSVSKAALLDKLDRAQAYAASQPQWQEFRRNLSRLDAFELRRGRHPREAVEALRSLLAVP
jgi:hypothetical protein